MTPCPECGDPIDFRHEAGHSPAMAASIEDAAPWSCPGCGISGVGDDLIECPDCRETVGPGHYCYRCEVCTASTDDLALVATPHGDVCPACLAELVAAP